MTQLESLDSFWDAWLESCDIPVQKDAVVGETYADNYSMDQSDATYNMPQASGYSISGYGTSLKEIPRLVTFPTDQYYVSFNPSYAAQGQYQQTYQPQNVYYQQTYPAYQQVPANFKSQQYAQNQSQIQHQKMPRLAVAASPEPESADQMDSPSSMDDAGGKISRVKRPMNSFLLFSNEIRPILQAKYKEKSNAQISKLIGEQWHKMDSEKKKAYVEAAEKIKEEFNKQHPDFVYTKRSRKRQRKELGEVEEDPAARKKRKLNEEYNSDLLDDSDLSSDDEGSF
jgi:hypothetical protein